MFVCSVGSLGLPELPFSNPIERFDSKSYAFHSTCLSAEVENAIHIMSIDEDRASTLLHSVHAIFCRACSDI
jgi:Uncharacterized alpha/beta hydrolase domain (DUF2235)